MSNRFASCVHVHDVFRVNCIHCICNIFLAYIYILYVHFTVTSSLTDFAQSSDSKEKKENDSKPAGEATEQEECLGQKEEKKEPPPQSPQGEVTVDYTDEETMKTLCSQVRINSYMLLCRLVNFKKCTIKLCALLHVNLLEEHEQN